MKVAFGFTSNFDYQISRFTRTSPLKGTAKHKQATSEIQDFFMNVFRIVFIPLVVMILKVLLT